MQVPATVQPGTENRPVVPITLDDAVKFALERNLDIAVQRLNPEINDIAYASIKSIYHPNLTSLISTQSTTNASRSTTSGGSAAGAADRCRRDQLQRRHRPEHSVGRRQLHGRVEQPQEHDDQLEHAVQPDLSAELVGHLHPAAVPQFLDRLDAPVAEGHPDQPRHLRRPAARDDHQYAVERPQRVLGLCLRRPGRRSRAEVARPGEQPGARQPDAGRGRHDGAD